MELVKTRPLWRVVFASGSDKGDIVVRESISLDSEEVAVLFKGNVAEQDGPQENVEECIVRMPIAFKDRDPSGPSQTRRTGWVTVDATALGGPKFFEPASYETELLGVPHSMPQEEVDATAAADGAIGWVANRTWKVVKLEAPEDRQLPVTVRAGPYGPGADRTPEADDIVSWLSSGDIVEQVGHSKKMRGFMVMPIRFIEIGGLPVKDLSEKGEGWVARRLVDKARDRDAGAWFEEIHKGENERRDYRRARRRDQD